MTSPNHARLAAFRALHAPGELAAARAAVEQFLVDGESARLLATKTKLQGMNALLKRA